MQLISWNVQWCRGLDGRVDPARIVAEIRRLGDFDVICLQEVADNFPDPRLAGSAGEDQFAALAALLSTHTLIAGWAVDHPGGDVTASEVEAGAADTIATSPSRAAGSARRRRFGNVVFSRLPVGQAFRHSLPFPRDPEWSGMPRIAIETVVIAPFGMLRVITTHLEYFSRRQRAAQVDALRAVYAEGSPTLANTSMMAIVRRSSASSARPPRFSAETSICRPPIRCTPACSCRSTTARRACTMRGMLFTRKLRNRQLFVCINRMRPE